MGTSTLHRSKAFGVEAEIAHVWGTWEGGVLTHNEGRRKDEA